MIRRAPINDHLRSDRFFLTKIQNDVRALIAIDIGPFEMVWPVVAWKQMNPEQLP